jgi:hypothetical protein
LVGYLLFFPPILVLGPFLALLIASRPAAPREWTAIAVAATWVAMLALESTGIASAMLMAWGVIAAGAFTALMITRDRPVISGAIGAACLATAGATAWTWLLGSRWQDVSLAVAHEGWELCRNVMEAGALSPARSEGVRVYVDAMAQGVGVAAGLFPGLLFVSALPGMALAWSWYHRIATRPIGRPSRPFAAFRFDDHLIWGVVLSLTLLVLPVPEPAAELGANLAVVAASLYVVRGAAVLWPAIGDLPSGVMVALGLLTLFILPVVLGGLCLLGLADTWVDFRRRFTPAASGGQSQWK